MRGKWLASLAFTSHGLSSKQDKEGPLFGTLFFFFKHSHVNNLKCFTRADIECVFYTILTIFEEA